MNARAKETGTAVVPVMRYRRLPEAINWLGKAFGFEKHHVAVADDGTILFAQLTLGSAMIMVGPIRTSAFDKFLKQPDEVGGAETQVCYFFVPDAQAHSVTAKAAGAEVIFDIANSESGGHSYSCRDPEGHLWNFGTYDPWQRKGMASKRKLRGIPVMRAMSVAGLLVGAAVMMMPGGAPLDSLQGVPRRSAVAKTDNASSNANAQAVFEGLAQEQSTKPVAEPATKVTQQQLAELLLHKDALESAVGELRQQWAQAVKQRDDAEQVAKDLQKRLDKAWFGKIAAERTARERLRQLSRERSERTGAGNNTQADKQAKNPLFPLQ